MPLLFFLLIGFSFSTHAQDRFILQASDVERMRGEVHGLGGKSLRKMESMEALVAELPPGAIKQLLKKNPETKVFEDRELTLVDHLAKGSKGGQTTSPPAQTIPWGINKIGAREANQITQGAGVKVCIVDTGVSKLHPDLKANIIGGRNFVIARGFVDPNGWDDDNGHGSHVAGTVAALDNGIGVVGVAPQASIYAVKVLDRRGSGRLSDVADGVHACRMAGADVINMSLGGAGDPTINDPFKIAVDQAVAAGIVVVVAAGNEGQDMNNTTPAGFSNVIAVAAANSSNQIASWSNFGLHAKDFTAPGVSVNSTWKGTGYNTISGTSMASPHVAGVVALAISSSSIGLKANPISGYAVSNQGSGLIDALATVLNH